MCLCSEALTSKSRPIMASPQTENYLNPDSQAALRMLPVLRCMLLLLSHIITTINTNVILTTISTTIQLLYLWPSNLVINNYLTILFVSILLWRCLLSFLFSYYNLFIVTSIIIYHFVSFFFITSLFLYYYHYYSFLGY